MTTETEGEFVGIFVNTGETRPVMSKPPELQATKKLIHEVQNALNIDDEYEATAAADWIANKMERFAAITSRPVFDMYGNGPQCSNCSMIWPLCGHQHMSEELGDDEEDNEKELSGE